MNLEEQITEGFLAWIVNLTCDEQNQTLAMQFIRDPESDAVYGTLIFFNVRNYRSELDFEEDRVEFEAGGYVENLIGIHEMRDAASPGYFIKTHVREISFNTADTPLWQPIQRLGAMP